MKKVFVVIVLLLTAMGGGYFYWRSLPDPSIATMPKVSARINDATFSLYAPTDTEGLQKGLSIFDSLEPNEGMIFRGMPVGVQTFWMKDMKFNIDMIWVNKENVVVHVVYDASKDSFPTKFQNPQSLPSAYVIELNAGSAEKYGINPGTQVSIN